MTLRTLAAAACLSICTASAGLAATFTVAGTDYDISTITGTFDDNESLLVGQPWWGDSAQALTFADAVGGGLGDSNFSGPYGPLFALDSLIIGADHTALVALYHPIHGVSIDWALADTTYHYAIATPVSPVPLPAGGLLLLTAFGGVAALKRRKKRAA
eukprot:TRINITY_DN9876_c0_g1_i1.p1 TRINITY_DN9876_c0_g1~~TRINITY_DN9876_c0_g1_i1.p1  ORF type:complete len:158 (-),score=2.03 TRINITY_DN9876_c0_g1_i1:63-536(-)